jgi:hypothetical protein
MSARTLAQWSGMHGLVSRRGEKTNPQASPPTGSDWHGAPRARVADPKASAQGRPLDGGDGRTVRYASRREPDRAWQERSELSRADALQSPSRCQRSQLDSAESLASPIRAVRPKTADTEPIALRRKHGRRRGRTALVGRIVRVSSIRDLLRPLSWTRPDSGQRDRPIGRRPNGGRASALGRGERLIPVVAYWSEESRATRFANLLGNSRLIPEPRPKSNGLNTQ